LGTVTAVVGSGVFVQLDAPFVDVLVRLEDLGHDRWEIDDDTLRAVALRSGDVVALGDRMNVQVIDASIFRRTVYGKRVAGEGASARHRERGSGKTGRRAEAPGRQARGGQKPTSQAASRDTGKGSDRSRATGAADAKKKKPTRPGKPGGKRRRR
jgi:ribonuclease R